MAKIALWQYKHTDGTVGVTQYHFMCPGCGYIHAVCLKVDAGPHEFNRDFEKPTFSPSLVEDFSPNHEKRCHSYIKDGKIQFLDDCWHNLKGQTVELPDIEPYNNI